MFEQVQTKLLVVVSPRCSSIDVLLTLESTVWLYDSDVPIWDPNGILTWMASELDLAERLGQRAWISKFSSLSPNHFIGLMLIDACASVGHMPFGKVDAMRDQSNYANQIFQRYHNTIAAHFYGHRYVVP